MKKSELRQLIRQSIKQQFNNVNKRSTSIIQAQRGIGGDDDGFLSDQQLQEQIKQATLGVLQNLVSEVPQVTSRIVDNFSKNVEDYGIMN